MNRKRLRILSDLARRGWPDTIRFALLWVITSTYPTVAVAYLVGWGG
ncbi:hypothetical protein [Gordonia malaquae]